MMIILAWGTFIESEYGRNVADFVLYGSRWFAMLLALLALNIGCSVLLRFPWKRRHLPFLLTHVGILLVLLGSYLTWQHGQEAQITLPEGTAGNSAIQPDKQHFELQNLNFLAPQLERIQTTNLSFHPGPFNWEDFERKNWVRKDSVKEESNENLRKKNLKNDRRRFQDTLWLAMQWGDRDLGVLPFSSDAPENLKNVKFEVLDYLASSTTQPVPPLDLNVLWKKRTLRNETELGEVQETPRHWERAKLSIKPQEHPGRLEIRGTRTELQGGERICYYMTTLKTEVDAFLAGAVDDSASNGKNAAPKADGTWGHLTLYFDGRNYDLNVDDLLNEATAGRRMPLKGTGFEIGDVRFRPRGPLLQLTLFTPTEEKETLTFYPDMPDMNIQAPVFGVFGTYQVDSARLNELNSEQIAKTTLERLSKPRLELLQGPDRRLYYRYWNGKRFIAAGIIPDANKTQNDGAKPSLTLAADSDDELNLVVEQFISQDLPGMRIVSMPVGRESGTNQRAKIRVTVDGKEDVFWLRPVFPTVVPLPPERDQVRYVHGKGRTVRVLWDFDRVPLGFGIFLKKFEKRTEPGTGMSSYYSSLVDFTDMPNRGHGQEVSRNYDGFTAIEKDVLIKMNQPAVFKGSGRRYRIYQASLSGPYHPGDYGFQELYDGKIFPWENRPRETIYMSKLSINDDPGRGLKYLGSFLLILGTAWFFYRRRY